jgi:branched-chain amino acid transport system substrate-binding protein
MTGKSARCGWLLAALVVAAAPAAAETVVKVGVLNTYSGPEAQAGEEMDKGIKLYVKEHDKDLPPGVKVELVFRDDTGPNPDVAKRLAQELITRDKVQFLTGVIWTPNAAAIAPLTVEAKIPFVDMNAAGVTLTRMSPYIVRVSYTLPQLVTPLAQFAAKQGWKRGYTAVPDFVPGHESETAFAKAFTEAGGTIVGQVSYPVINPDFTPFFARAKDVKPDVLYIFNIAGKQSTQIIKVLTDLGIRQAGINPVSGVDLTTDEELPNMGDAALGINSASNYSYTANRPANKAFFAAWQRAYGADSIAPNFFAVQGWDGMAAIYDVVKATKGKFTSDEAMKILTNWKNPDSPRGPIMIDPETRDIIQNIYIRHVEKVDGKLANVEFVTYPQVKDPWKQQNPPK